MRTSDEDTVRTRFKEIYGSDALYVSDKWPKKYFVIRPDGRRVYFGDIRYEDYTAHRDDARRARYLARALATRGKWRDDSYSPNMLAVLLLW
jgi:hypothetical protein